MLILPKILYYMHLAILLFLVRMVSYYTWYFANESYPDGVSKLISPRFMMPTLPRSKEGQDVPDYPQMEYISKFSGTRIIAAEVTTILQAFI